MVLVFNEKATECFIFIALVFVNDGVNMVEHEFALTLVSLGLLMLHETVLTSAMYLAQFLIF